MKHLERCIHAVILVGTGLTFAALSATHLPLATEQASQLVLESGGSRNVWQKSAPPWAPWGITCGCAIAILGTYHGLRVIWWSSEAKPTSALPPAQSPKIEFHVQENAEIRQVDNVDNEAIANSANSKAQQQNLKPQPVQPKRPTPVQTGLIGTPLEPALYAGLVSIIGQSGGGKSTLSAAILRERLKLGHEVRILNHHYEFGSYEPLTVYGIGKTLKEQFSHIERGLLWFLGLRETRYEIRQFLPRSEWKFQSEPVTLLVEELGEYADNCHKDLLKRFLKTICLGIRKANLHVILVSQNDTLEMFGGASAGGMAKLLQDGVFKIELEAQPDASQPGGWSPTGWGQISLNGNKPERVKIPDISELFPSHQWELDFSDLFPEDSNNIESERENKNKVDRRNGESTDYSGEDSIVEDRAKAAFIFQLPAEIPIHEQPLTPAQELILSYAKRVDSPIVARMVQQNGNLREKLQGYGVSTALEIRAVFSELAQLKRGETGQVGGDKQWFQAY